MVKIAGGRLPKGTPIVLIASPTVFKIGNSCFADQLYIYNRCESCAYYFDLDF